MRLLQVQVVIVAVVAPFPLVNFYLAPGFLSRSLPLTLFHSLSAATIAKRTHTQTPRKVGRMHAPSLSRLMYSLPTGGHSVVIHFPVSQLRKSHAGKLSTSLCVAVVVVGALEPLG